MAAASSGAPAASSALKRLAHVEATLCDADGRGVGPAELDPEGLRCGFRRFQMPHSIEMRKDDLMELVQYLGLLLVSEDDVRHFAQEISPYSEVDFDEFLRFINRYFRHERERLRTLFSQFDPNGTGEISVVALRRLMVDIGLIPLRGMVQETLAAIGVGIDSALEFEDFVCFLTIYRHAEGFMAGERSRLRRVFLRCARDVTGTAASDSHEEDLRLPAAQLGKVLTQLLGLQVAEQADHLQAYVERLCRRRGAAGADVLEYREFLIFARRLREAELQRHKAEFARWDVDGSGTMDVEEIYSALRNLGYEPLRAVIFEILREVDFERSNQLDLEEWMHFLLIYQGRDGFLREEVDKMLETFTQFDFDNSETIDVTELGAMLRQMGHYMGLEDLHMLVKEVDVLRNGELDMAEFLRLMRLHRDSQIRRLRSVFDERKHGKGLSARLLAEDIPAAIKDALNYMCPNRSPGGVEADNHGNGDGNQREPSPGVDFEAFVALAESARTAELNRQRRFAGFAVNTVRQFKEIFERCDVNQNGLIDTKELEGLLKELGLMCRSERDRTSLFEKLELAKVAALEAEADVLSRDSKDCVCFWVLVQLMRIIVTERDREAEEREAQAMKELGFSKAEVEDFREVFVRWARRRSSTCEEDCLADPRTPGCLAFGLTQPTGSAWQDALDMEVFYKLVVSLGVSMSLREREELEIRARRAGTDHLGRLTFIGFLIMMRWLLDSDFAGINRAAALLIT